MGSTTKTKTDKEYACGLHDFTHYPNGLPTEKRQVWEAGKNRPLLYCRRCGEFLIGPTEESTDD